MPYTFTLTVPDPDVGQVDLDVYKKIIATPEYEVWQGDVDIERVGEDLAQAVDAWVGYGTNDYTLVAVVLIVRSDGDGRNVVTGEGLVSKFNLSRRQWTPWELRE
jgi:hypothetical protein